MAATSSRATTKPAAKPKVLPPARSLAQQQRVAGSKFARAGSKQARGARQRFALPTGFRRSAAANQFAQASSLKSVGENSAGSQPLISGAHLLNALERLPQRDPLQTERSLTIHPW